MCPIFPMTLYRFFVCLVYTLRHQALGNRQIDEYECGQCKYSYLVGPRKELLMIETNEQRWKTPYRQSQKSFFCYIYECWPRLPDWPLLTWPHSWWYHCCRHPLPSRLRQLAFLFVNGSTVILFCSDWVEAYTVPTENGTVYDIESGLVWYRKWNIIHNFFEL